MGSWTRPRRRAATLGALLVLAAGVPAGEGPGTVTAELGAGPVLRREPFPAGLTLAPPVAGPGRGAPARPEPTGVRRPPRDQAPPLAREAWAFVLDQDMFFPPQNQDRDYTQGVGLEWFRVWDDEPEPVWLVGSVHGFLDRLTGRFGLDVEGPGRQVTSWGLEALAYTPDDLKKRAVIPDDRPYAAVISVGWRRFTLTPDQVVGSELRVGALGTRVAEEVQGAIHSVFRFLGGGSDVPRDPKGWDNQIADGGEPTLLYRVSSDRRLGGEAGRWDVYLLRDVSLGWRTHVAAGLGFRRGLLVNGWESAPVDPLGRVQHVPSLGEGDEYLWGAVRVRLVAYDALLQGQFRDSPLEVPAGDVSRAVVHGAAGFTLSPWPGWQLSYAIHARSHELDDPDRWHFWGGVTLQGRS